MKRVVTVLLLSIFLACIINAQKESYTAPVKWERYKLNEQNLSLNLPKLPVMISESNSCTQTKTDRFAVYANDVIYGFNVINKLALEVPDWCENKNGFGKKSFKERIKEFKAKKEDSVEEKLNVNKREGVLVKDKLLTYLFIDDLENDRWFEFWTANSEISNPQVEEYFKSILFRSETNAIEIGEGSDRTLGDKSENSSESISPKLENKGVQLFTKPRPVYTEIARKNNYEGSVTMRVTFLANGGIGSVQPIDEIPYGLTEEAIKAARKIVFIPAKRNGINISESKRVQYSFTIY
jgi:hypothetical protein